MEHYMRRDRQRIKIIEILEIIEIFEKKNRNFIIKYRIIFHQIQSLPYFGMNEERLAVV